MLQVDNASLMEDYNPPEVNTTEYKKRQNDLTDEFKEKNKENMQKMDQVQQPSCVLCSRKTTVADATSRLEQSSTHKIGELAACETTSMCTLAFR